MTIMTNTEGVGKTAVKTAKKKRPTKETEEPVTTEAPAKGRKTRASKIVTKQQIIANTTPVVTNVILNLKCSMNDLKEYNSKLSRMISNPLEYNSSAPPEVKYYDGEKPFGTFIQTKDLSSSSSSSSHDAVKEEYVENKSIAAFMTFSAEEELQHESIVKFTKTQVEDKIVNPVPMDDCNDDVNVKDMSAKLKQLKIQLYKNSLHSEKKSACFWCTYEFDNPPCYIPKYEMDGVIYGYGSFCRPECAVAYLMKENIDDSTKFDRYHLLNQIYSKVYDCKKNIKPAPDPHYLLDKFYGNLNIQEYRRLLKTEHLLLVIDKPLTRILPELHEDTDDAFTKIYGIKASSGNSSGVYKVKRQSEQPQGPSKASIIKNTFGIST